MFRIGIIGGRLQGLEAAYLARAAGYHVTLFDRHWHAPARGLSDVFHCVDAATPSTDLVKLVAGLDALLPAVEDDRVLVALDVLAQRAGVPILHDASGYALTSSKQKSNFFLNKNGIPVSPQYPDCPFPVIVKPSRGSGSHGVRVVETPHALEAISADLSSEYGELIVEAFQQGPSLSMEVIGNGLAAVAFVATELAFDERFDCKRVFSPHRLKNNLNKPFADMCERIGRRLGLNGLMDVEVIVDPSSGRLWVLEIDARLPSQTPIAVYHSTGINLVEAWVNVSVFGHAPEMPAVAPGCAILEHLAVEADRMVFIGETRLIPWDRPDVRRGNEFFGADTAITDYFPGKPCFKATLITHGKDWDVVRLKRDRLLHRMKTELNLREVSDPEPAIP